MNGISTSHVIVEPGGKGVVTHVGLHALGCFADRLGLGDSLSARIPPTGERLPVHDRGKVLVHTDLMLAGGGESCEDSLLPGLLEANRTGLAPAGDHELVVISSALWHHLQLTGRAKDQG